MCLHDEAEFNDQLDWWAQSALRACNKTFAQFVRALPGVYPSAARASLLRLAETGAVSSELVVKMLSEPTTPSRLREPERRLPVPPVPHPLDFEWRYAAVAIDRLLCRADDVAGPLVLLGAPSVAVGAVSQYPGRPVVVLDANPAAVSHLRSTCPEIDSEVCDLTRDALPPVPLAAMIITDPPWYPDLLEAFLWAACRLSQPRALVRVSLPPLGTRPGMREERARLLSIAERMGLARISHHG